MARLKATAGKIADSIYNRKKVLLIDDDEEDFLITKCLAAKFHALEMDLQWVPGPEEAFKALGKNSFDCILMDYYLGSTTGLELLRALREKGFLLPVIFLTGRSDVTLDLAAMKEGADDYLEKGELSSSLLERSIRYALERRESERQRKSLEDRLLQMQKFDSLGLLAGSVAHDFNNLLTSIMGNCSVALNSLQPEDGQYELWRRVEKIANKAAGLTNQMLAFSGKGKFAEKTLDLNGMIESISDVLSRSVYGKIEIHMELKSSLPPLIGDPGQIHQGLFNLVMNASESIGNQKGRITLRTSACELLQDDLLRNFIIPPPKPGIYITLEVTDTGKGFAIKDILRLFEPFYTTKPGGKGLGLSALMGIVRAHKAGIEADSSPDGARFKLYFPAQHALKAKVEMHTPSPELEKQKPPCILAVDDDPMILEMYQTVFRSTGFRVVVAQDGFEAIDVLKEQPGAIDIVLLDLVMPMCPGEECFFELRAIRPDIPIILNSGFDANETAPHLTSQPKVGFIQKPYRPSQLIGMVGRMLNPA